MAADDAAAATAVEIRFGQMGIASATLRSADPVGVRGELLRKVAAAPALFARAPLVLDLSRLPTLPAPGIVRDLFAAARDAGLMPVGLSYGSDENAALARELDVPQFARFRAAAAAGAPTATDAAAAQHHAASVRSGQQVYARQRDLVVCGAVGNGAEAIADGSIHVYGRLAGRALAGASGNVAARIYCREFDAELVSIAGHYRVLEEVPDGLRGRSVQVRLDGERLVLEKL